MILKIMISKGNYAYRNCEVLKCDVKDVVCLRNEDKEWVAYDAPSGLQIIKAKTKKDLTDKVNSLKDKIETIRSTSYYQDQIKIKEEAVTINTIEDIQTELNDTNKEENKVIISEKNFKARVKHLKDDLFLYHKDEKNSSFRLYGLAILYLNRLYDLNISLLQYKNEMDFDKVLQGTLKLIEEKNFKCDLESFINQMIDNIENGKWVNEWLLEIIEDYDATNNTNYYKRAIDARQKILAKNEEEHQKRIKEREEKERQRKRQLEEEMRKGLEEVKKAIMLMKQNPNNEIINKTILVFNSDTGLFKETSLLMYLLEMFNINVALRTKELINNVSIFSKNRYYGRKSSVLFSYLEELYNKILEY